MNKEPRGYVYSSSSPPADVGRLNYKHEVHLSILNKYVDRLVQVALRKRGDPVPTEHQPGV